MGQAYDSSTGLYYFNARWYDASIGRFISADPLPGNPFQSGSTNRYAYALDNPIAYEDVSGLKSVRAAQTQQDDPPPSFWPGTIATFLSLLAALFGAIATILIPLGTWLASEVGLAALGYYLGVNVALWGSSIAAIGSLLTLIGWILVVIVVVLVIVAIVFFVIWLINYMQENGWQF